jgi:hypothetical protein
MEPFGKMLAIFSARPKMSLTADELFADLMKNQPPSPNAAATVSPAVSGLQALLEPENPR